MKKIIFITFLFLSLAQQARAEKQGVDDLSLMKQVIEYAATADVYGAFCDKPSSLADGFMGKFNRSVKEKNDLLALKLKYGQETKAKLEKDGLTCKNLDFMMQRYEIMRKLKDASYLLNGVDPSTLPQQNIPDLEGLMPARDPKKLQPQDL